jgi:hypothetical protein
VPKIWLDWQDARVADRAAMLPAERPAAGTA